MAQQGDGPRQFDDFQATQLYCPTCRRAQAVRKRLLLVLPDGDLFEYTCGVCGTSVGSQRDSQQERPPGIFSA